jgi:3-isopropylmalate dehydratase small subunit
LVPTKVLALIFLLKTKGELMEKFNRLDGVAAPLNIVNIDTDMIIPKQFLKTIKRTGLGKSLFYEMRYTQEGVEVPEFVLNKPAYRKAQILVAGDNFGCGRANMHLGPCWILAFVASSQPALPTFSTTTASKTAFCPSSFHLMI